MDKKFIRIFPNNVKKFLRNSMFDFRKDKSTEVPIFERLKIFLEQKKIFINTYDISPEVESYLDIHFDLPYPTFPNLNIWKRILINRGKKVLICTEPPIVNPFNYMRIFHNFFTKVYTWNDDLVDQKKYFKYRLPKVSSGIKTKSKKFNDRKFLALVNSNKFPFYPFKIISSFGKELYTDRIRAIDFFEENIPDKFFLYGIGWNKPKKYNLRELLLGSKKYSTYKGEVADKIKLLSGFKYCLCFENLADVNGYITEKITDCFKAKCVPIYWGASNIEKYIPKDCFIDFRDFDDYEKLLSFLFSIDEKKYNHYIKNIERLLKDKRFISLWFEDGFSKFFLEDILELT